MNHYAAQWIEDWCIENGWTDWFQERTDYWAFPPYAVMPVPIPIQVLQSIKAKRGLCLEEKIWCAAAGLSAVTAASLSYFFATPMPLVAAFAFCAIVMARMEDDNL